MGLGFINNTKVPKVLHATMVNITKNYEDTYANTTQGKELCIKNTIFVMVGTRLRNVEALGCFSDLLKHIKHLKLLRLILLINNNSDVITVVI